MHGLIFTELKKYVEAKYNGDTWQTLLEQAGLNHQLYLASAVYPDGDALALIGTASQVTGISAALLLEDFGQFILPNLIQQYRFLVKPSWGLLDFLENTEETIHKIMRFHKGVAPPRLRTHRLGENKLIITYDSARKMCPLLKGMVKGSARAYEQEITIMESRCMLQGDPECNVTVQVETAGVHPSSNAFQRAVAPNR
ncbi:MAG: heme NO-binding domain-containing protein [Candidatus Angelobacter sp.]